MFTHEEVISRLEEAGRTLLSLPPERAVGHCRTSIWEYVREPVHSMALPGKFERAHPNNSTNEWDRRFYAVELAETEARAALEPTR